LCFYNQHNITATVVARIVNAVIAIIAFDFFMMLSFGLLIIDGISI